MLIVLAFVLLASETHILSQANDNTAQAIPPYNLKVAVDEVVLRFHAADAQGRPITDLHVDELHLRDNGKHPRKIVDFQLLHDLPIRAGILIDTSESMVGSIPTDRSIALQYAQHLFAQNADQAFVMQFGKVPELLQPWTTSAATLMGGIRNVGASRVLGGTVIFDTLFEACHGEFGTTPEPSPHGNFILLFSDGEDTASYVTQQVAIDMCQRANTAIYVFLGKVSPGSIGPSMLSELAAQTGGRVFRGSTTNIDIQTALQTITADLRNEYRVVYQPASLKHDGAFHAIELVGPDRVEAIQTRSGYYAPSQ